MPQKIIIAEQERIAAILSDERVDKLIVAQGHYQIGDVYLGTIENVLPGIDAAFVNIGASEKNGFIHVTDLGPLKLKKNSASITELLEPRQKVLVQVMKEPTGNKGPRVTGNISLPGRYLILQANGQGVNISRQINTETERNRLKALGVLIKPPGTGLLLRSEAEGVVEDLIIEDLENLLKKWDLIQQAGDRSNPPILLSRDEDFINRVLRDNVNAKIAEIIVESQEAVERVKSFLGTDSSKSINIHFLSKPNNLIEQYKIDLAILNALKPRVDLPSGGYIIIEPTEALTVIDVNSGSFTRSANSRETVLWTNCEAAVEIARQLQLRNIGGVIIIDFIDMESRRDQLQLLEYFTAAIKNDSSRPQISQLTELGLVELTRKRQGQNIYELFSKECTSCSGLGHIPNINDQNNVQNIIENDLLQKNSYKKNTEANINNIKSNDDRDPIITNLTEETSKDNLLDQSSNNTEKECINIKMDEDEEYVYSFLGINPIFILDKQPTSNNIQIEVNSVKSNQKVQTSIVKSKDKNKELNNADKQESIKTVKTSVEESEIKSTKGNIVQDINNSDQDQSHQIDLAEVEDSKDITQNENNSLNEESNESLDSAQEADDNRRRRRRSSAAI